MRRLPMRKIGEALRLRASGRTMREICVSLGAGRSTISGYLKRAEMTGLTWSSPDGLSDPETWSEEKTRTEADLIKTRVRKTIEQDLIDDPYAQKVFSEMLKDAIREAEAMFDHPHKQYTLFKDLEEQVRARATPDIPGDLGDNEMAKSFFGAFLLEIPSDVIDEVGQVTIIAEAQHIDATVEDAIRSHSINPANIEAEIRKALLPRFFRLLGGLDPANALLDRVVEIVRAGSVRGTR